MYYINSSSQSLLSLYYRSCFKSHESSPASRSSRFLYIYINDHKRSNLFIAATNTYILFIAAMNTADKDTKSLTAEEFIISVSKRGI